MEPTETLFDKPDFISPKRVLTEIGLKEGDIVVDYGSGPGHWAIPAAKIVTSSGKVYALEDNIDILNLLISKAEMQKVSNIEVEEINLEKGVSKHQIDADLVLVSNILHLISDKDSFIKRASKLLGKSGKLLIIDWSKDNFMFGPPKELRLDQEETISMCERLNLHFNCTVNAGWHHFGLVFEKGRENEKRDK